jgi:molecular chaperone Hsp33
MNTDIQTAPHQVHRYVTNDLTVRVAAVNATVPVQEMQKIQSSMPLATLGVGRGMVASLLMAANLKEGQEVGLLFRGNGPLGSLYAEASYEGHVRGYCPNPLYQAPQDADILNLGKAMGTGTLSVARHQPFQRQPHHGTVNMVSGEIGDDIAHYLAQSHQIRSLVRLGVYLDTYGQVQAAGGLLIEVMPGVEDSVVETLYRNYESINLNISRSLYEGAQVKDLIEPYMKGLPFTEIPHEPKISYFCPCSAERVVGALSILGVTELEEMIRDQEPAHVTCQICGRKYEVGVAELENLKESLRKNSMH